MYKKAVSLILIVILALTVNIVSAENTQNINQASQVLVSAKTAIVDNVNVYGTNLNHDGIDGDKFIKPDTDLQIAPKEDHSLSINLTISDEDVSINAIPAGKSENSDIVFYAAKTNNPNYSIVYSAYEENFPTSNLYFQEYISQQEVHPSAVLKLYLKDESSDTRDYIFLEAFDFEYEVSDSFISKLPSNNTLASWGATQFEPIETTFVEDASVIAPMAATTTKYWSMSRTFSEFGDTSTHNIKFYTQIDYSDIIVGQEARQYFTLKIYEKSMTFNINTVNNSNTHSYLHVDSLKVDQTSIPNTAWKSTEIDGVVLNSGGGGQLSASLGVNYGLLNISYTIPFSFSSIGNVDINQTYTSYQNGVNGNYTRSIDTELSNSFKLTQLNHFFEVASTLRDYGNVARSATDLKARWHVDIINAGNNEVTPYEIDLTAPVAIK